MRQSLDTFLDLASHLPWTWLRALVILPVCAGYLVGMLIYDKWMEWFGD